MKTGKEERSGESVTMPTEVEAGLAGISRCIPGKER
jgi:hypothetical protein